ncbi:Membrane insertase YidC/Oxa1, C-terminal [Ostreococcus tauri]|uniref:Membrane insertase YidC/Oxa1, C-terminal n=2 Tax=Ostreococcus tauri TaxID=70448 RepID=A0A090M0Z7_OSTTA|nr:Membrane insertase YidC/Oxa1, C-terminal [Ostreococcus tauri]CEF97885.1 Membrane insertase YidC/Oxa1, C-terminal [Ostreococcus tauri]|eukprot:XP_003079210.2 Membrane insertase YidC/Oxa1, C-terminal [Ostreococcus tauri]
MNAPGHARGAFDLADGSAMEFVGHVRSTVERVFDVSDGAIAVDGGSSMRDAMMAVQAEERAAKIASGEIQAPQRMEGWLAPVSNALEDLLFTIKGQLLDLGVPYPTGNAIIIVTILVKMVTYPLTKDQVVSSLNMKNLQPQIAAIREKYEDDQERMNKEINRVYEENGVNPLAGCGPALLSFPVLAGLYRAFNNAGIDGAFDEPWFFLPSLAGPTDARDLSWLLPLDADLAPPIGWDDASLYLLFPIMTTLSQFVSMEVLKPEEDEKTKEMQNQSVLLKLLPFFIGYISLTVPAGLALYWFWNNVFTTGIQVYLRNGGAVATVEATEVRIKIPLGCVVIPEDAEILPADYKPEGPSVVWDEEWLANWQQEQIEAAPDAAFENALAAGMSEEEAKNMEEMLRNRLPRKKSIAERKLATETELKALIREYKAKDDAETVKVLEDGLEALRAYKAELKLKAETDELGVEDITMA